MRLLGNKKNKYELSWLLSVFFQELDTLAWCKTAYAMLEFVYLHLLYKKPKYQHNKLSLATFDRVCAQNKCYLHKKEN